MEREGERDREGEKGGERETERVRWKERDGEGEKEGERCQHPRQPAGHGLVACVYISPRKGALDFLKSGIAL